MKDYWYYIEEGSGVTATMMEDVKFGISEVIGVIIYGGVLLLLSPIYILGRLFGNKKKGASK